MKRTLITAAGLLALLSGSALAANAVAEMQTATGKVMINQGKGFVPASEGLMLNPGDKVFVGKDASAVIAYGAANCTVTVASATVVAVQDQAPCAEGQNMAAVDSVFVNAASYQGAAGASYIRFVVPAFILGGGGIFTWRMVHEHRHRHHHSVSAP